MRIARTIAAAQLRHGWWNLVGIAVLVALVGGFALAGLAGAIRTSTAVDRFIESSETADVLVNPNDGDDSELGVEAIAALPMVEQVSTLRGVLALPRSGSIRSIEDLFSGPSLLGSAGGAPYDFHRPVLLEGHMPDPEALDELYLDRTYAASAGYGLGDVIESTILSSDDLARMMQAEGAGENAMFELVNTPDFGTDIDLRVVGIGNGLEGIVVDESFEPQGGWITPALYRSLGEPSLGWWGAVVRLTDPSELDGFRSAVDAMAPGEKVVYQTREVTRAKALRGTRPSAVALAIFAGVTALLGLLIVWQAIARRCQLDARDNPTFAAIGMTRRERATTAIVRLTAAAAVGAIGAGLIAVALSWFTPVGPARSAEPDPGWDVNAAVVVGGSLAWFLVVALIGVAPAWLNSRSESAPGPVRPSQVAAWLGAAGVPPHLSTGIRFGLEPGRGATAVPTRATNLGAITAVAIAAATIVFAASLDRVVDDGRFYGTNFDVWIDWDGEILTDEAEVAGFTETMVADADVEAVATLRITEVGLDGQLVTSVAFGGGEASVGPTVAAGRAPDGVDEVALGSSTMDRLGVGIGDTVALRTNGFEGPAVVVGRVVLPGVGLYEGSNRTSIGDGALISGDLPADPSADGVRFAVDLVGGADIAAFQDRLRATLAAPGGLLVDRSDYTILVTPAPRPSEIDSLARLRSLPLVLSGALILVVGVTVLNAMVVAVRRRRHDLAVMQAMGSTGGGVTTVGISQGVTIGVVGLLIGLPVGIVGGRWLWIALADSFGTIAEPVVPTVGVSVLAAAVLALAALSGVVPVRFGLRHRPAEVLRSE